MSAGAGSNGGRRAGYPGRGGGLWLRMIFPAGLRARLVPSAWTVAALEIRPVAYTLPITGAQAAPEIVSGGSGSLFADMALAGGVGRAVAAGAAAPARTDQRVRMNRREHQKPPQRPANEAVTEIATELRELANRAQSLLAKLADSGLMTAEEVTEQKRRFLG